MILYQFIYFYKTPAHFIHKIFNKKIITAILFTTDSKRFIMSEWKHLKHH